MEENPFGTDLFFGETEGSVVSSVGLSLGTTGLIQHFLKAYELIKKYLRSLVEDESRFVNNTINGHQLPSE
jgi:hypothetical protein